MVKSEIIEKFVELQLKQSPSSEVFIRHLIKVGIIKLDAMRDYLIVMQYPIYLKANKLHVGHTLIDLSDDFDISERMVRNIYQRQSKFY